MDDVLSFNEFIKKYKYKRSDELIAYELYLIIFYLRKMMMFEESLVLQHREGMHEEERT